MGLTPSDEAYFPWKQFLNQLLFSPISKVVWDRRKFLSLYKVQLLENSFQLSCSQDIHSAELSQAELPEVELLEIILLERCWLREVSPDDHQLSSDFREGYDQKF